MIDDYQSYMILSYQKMFFRELKSKAEYVIFCGIKTIAVNVISTPMKEKKQREL